MEIATFKIKGMTCDYCAQSIEKQFAGNEGIVESKVSYPSGSGEFKYDPDQITQEEIIDTINATGHYTVDGEIESSRRWAFPPGRQRRETARTDRHYRCDRIIAAGVGMLKRNTQTTTPFRWPWSFTPSSVHRAP